MSIELLSLCRFGATAIVTYRDGKKVFQRAFPASVSDDAIVSAVKNGKKEKAPAVPPEAQKKGQTQPEQTPKKNMEQQMDEQRILRERYLADLKSAGVDTAGLRAFSRIEELWLEKCGKQKGGK